MSEIKFLDIFKAMFTDYVHHNSNYNSKLLLDTLSNTDQSESLTLTINHDAGQLLKFVYMAGCFYNHLLQKNEKLPFTCVKVEALLQREQSYLVP